MVIVHAVQKIPYMHFDLLMFGHKLYVCTQIICLRYNFTIILKQCAGQFDSPVPSYIVVHFLSS